MQTFEPAICLAPYIKTFVVVESNNRIINRLLPDTALVAAFRLRGQVQFNDQVGETVLPMFSISGLRKSYKLAEYDENSANLLVQFKEGGANAFLDLPLHELFASNIELDQFFRPSELMDLEEQMNEAESVQMKVDVVQDFFIARLRHQNPDLLIAHAIEQIKMAKGILSIKDLSGYLNISIDAFEKRFRKTVGATPKQFADIVRMKSLIAQAPFNRNLLDTALESGFFDQSHFIRNFKGFTGQTPKEFFTTVSTLRNA